MKLSLVTFLAVFCILPTIGQPYLEVDFRYAPDWHATLICLPDDSCKTLVAPEGQILYDFGYKHTHEQKERFASEGNGGKKFFAYANGVGFQTVFHILADEDIRFVNQKLYSATVPIVETYSETKFLNVKQEAFAYSSHGVDKFDHVDVLRNGATTPREDIILSTVTNKTDREQLFSPKIIVNSEYPVNVSNKNTIIINGKKKMHFGGTMKDVHTNLGDNKVIVELAAVVLKPHETKVFANLYDNGIESELTRRFTDDYKQLADEFIVLKSDMINYWENQSSVPKNLVTIPDKQIQNLIDASIRNIWQAREITDDKISFQVGPTCYRGLWIVDGAFLLETATMLDRGEDARDGIEYMLSFQEPSGKFGKLTPKYWKENGIVLWTCVRHARLTQDKEWLRSVWPKLRKTVGFIKELRKMTLENDIAADDGLIPPGDIDGGLGGADDKGEYTNIYWNLLGIKAMVNAAEWIGEENDAQAWKNEYNDFYATFQKAAQRDMILDGYGNKYLPIPMESRYHSLPQRAQWAFCHGVYPGQLFTTDDPIAKGTMNMLHTTLQEGMVMGTGWIMDGIWNYFAGFYGHACLWMGESEKAIQSLYAFANHASPLFAWREEHNPRDLPRHFVGDMPHNWASAEFVRLAIHLLAIDRENELHLLEGFPKDWVKPGMETSLKNVATPFGKLTFSLKVDHGGKEAHLKIYPLSDASCEKIVVHKKGWAMHDGESILELDPSKENNLRITIEE